MWRWLGSLDGELNMFVVMSVGCIGSTNFFVLCNNTPGSLNPFLLQECFFVFFLHLHGYSFFSMLQIFNGVFLKVNKATMNMLHRVEPYVTYGYPLSPSLSLYIYIYHLYKDSTLKSLCHDVLLDVLLYRYPNLKSVRELVYKRGYGKLNKQRVALTDNSIIEQVWVSVLVFFWEGKQYVLLLTCSYVIIGFGQVWHYLHRRPHPWDHVSWTAL